MMSSLPRIMSPPFPRRSWCLSSAPETVPMDHRNGIKILSRRERGDIAWEGSMIPIYGPLATFEGSEKTFLLTGNGQTAGLAIDLPGRRILRLGYDLFDEVEYLLRRGQPVENAQVPTLEMHISMLRKWILGAGIPLVEIPPFPSRVRLYHLPHPRHRFHGDPGPQVRSLDARFRLPVPGPEISEGAGSEDGPRQVSEKRPGPPVPSPGPYGAPSGFLVPAGQVPRGGTGAEIDLFLPSVQGSPGELPRWQTGEV